jgi:DNA polymerase-3 subunit chi
VQDKNRVDFYILAVADEAAMMRFACRLTEKAYHLQHRVHLHTESAAAAAALDELLWTFRQGSFVPHEIALTGSAAVSPVTIGYGAATPPAGDLLVNLSQQLPEFVDRFTRIAEIVDGAEISRQLGRARFREYRQQGRELSTHNIAAAS